MTEEKEIADEEKKRINAAFDIGMKSFMIGGFLRYLLHDEIEKYKKIMEKMKSDEVEEDR